MQLRFVTSGGGGGWMFRRVGCAFQNGFSTYSLILISEGALALTAVNIYTSITYPSLYQRVCKRYSSVPYMVCHGNSHANNQLSRYETKTTTVFAFITLTFLCCWCPDAKREQFHKPLNNAVTSRAIRKLRSQEHFML